jgi:hypothetical protein
MANVIYLWIFDPKLAYLSRGDSNIIVADWGPLAKYPCYFTAKLNIFQVGTCASQMLSLLTIKFSLHVASVHAIGFSLGAHIAALTSNGLLAASGSKLGRITGTEHRTKPNNRTVQFVAH